MKQVNKITDAGEGKAASSAPDAVQGSRTAARTTVQQMAEVLSLSPLAVPAPDRTVSGGYIGDLLSWVMGRAQSGDAWITIMSNINIVAVAALADVACIILAEDVVPGEDVIRTAGQKGVNLYSTPKTAYETAVSLAALLT